MKIYKPDSSGKYYDEDEDEFRCYFCKKKIPEPFNRLTLNVTTYKLCNDCYFKVINLIEEELENGADS